MMTILQDLLCYSTTITTEEDYQLFTLALSKLCIEHPEETHLIQEPVIAALTTAKQTSNYKNYFSEKLVQVFRKVAYENELITNHNI